MSEGGWICLCSKTDFDVSGVLDSSVYVGATFSLRIAKFM
jgi:hypothetical protein